MKTILLLVALTLGLFGCTFVSKYIHDMGNKEPVPSASPSAAMSSTPGETGATSSTGATPVREVSKEELFANFQDEFSSIPELIKIPNGTYSVRNPKCKDSPLDAASVLGFGNAEYKIARRGLTIAYDLPGCRMLVSYLIKRSGIKTSSGNGLLDMAPSGNIECSNPSTCGKAASHFGGKCGSPSSFPSVIYGLRLKSRSPFSVELVSPPTDRICSNLNKGSGPFSFELFSKE